LIVFRISYSSIVFTFITAVLSFTFATIGTVAQSSLPEFPTPVTSNELSGIIKAREIGDSRPTTYYYWFDGGQGDVFINLVTKNFAGDIDIFLQTGLKPLTKIVVYPDFGEVETGRVLYLRKPEKLLMRVQGRSPNDDSATFRVKFAGSFVTATAAEESPEIPKVTGETPGSVAVNSVGTKIPQAPKPKDIVEDIKRADESSTEETRKDLALSGPEAKVEKRKAEDKETPKLEVVVSEGSVPATTEKAESKPTSPPRRTRNTARNAVRKSDLPVSVETPEKKGEDTLASAEETEKASPKKENTKSADPLANVRLVVVFKDGGKIERPLPEIFRFSVDRGVLTVVSKNGSIGRYQMVDVAKVTIE